MYTLTLFYFGDLMNQLGIGRETLRIPANKATVAGLLSLLAMRGGDWQKAFATPRATLQITVNKKPAGLDAPLTDGDEIALIEAISL